ncbi:MAG TPA: hypothetical protein VGB77_00025 [Abditibacteriaceae bacterium]|jgi:hypothetical protein
MFIEVTLEVESQQPVKAWVNLSRFAVISLVLDPHGNEVVAVLFMEIGSNSLNITVPEEVAKIKAWLQVQEGNGLTSFAQTSRISRGRNN